LTEAHPPIWAVTLRLRSGDEERLEDRLSAITAHVGATLGPASWKIEDIEATGVLG